MNCIQIIILTIILFLLSSCSVNRNTSSSRKQKEDSFTYITEDYKLVIPENQEGLLVLFPCYPCDAVNTESEFPVLDVALENNVAIMMMNFNQHLWLSKEEKQDLELILTTAIAKYSLNFNNTFIGGFSSGGTVSLLMTDYLKESKSSIQPEGVFIADSPVDLLGLYNNAHENVEKNFSETAVQESTWIIDLFDDVFGIGDSAMVNYTYKSTYLAETHSMANLSNLNDVQIRLYSEPDTTWWKVNRQADYEDMNAYYIERMFFDLIKMYGKENVEYIKTENRGYRANGERHPHSWGIIEENNLLEWILSQ